MLMVNPLTAVSFISIARKGGHKAFIQTAASSALGQMVARYANLRGMTVINTVRRREQADALRANGEAHVLCSADDGFTDALRALAHRLKATIAFDAVGGQMSAVLATAMPHGGKVVQYGGLAGQPAHIEIADVLFHAKSLEGYWVPLYLRKAGTLGQLPMVAAVRKHASTIFATKVLEKVPLDRFPDALRLQRERASEGKVLLVP
jgi:NADPH:quinone reductase-like Zn-dependent oxidoreductase